MFFDGWGDLLRIVVVGSAAYLSLILLLRATGKRTLSKMNAFDFVVTVALGSTLASALLSSEVSLSEGVAAFALLCGLQYAVTWLSVRSAAFQAAIKAEPTLLFYRGGYLDAQLKAERLTHEEVLAALRSQGVGDLADVEAVVLETDGSISVVRAGGERDPGALRTVHPRPGKSP